MNNILLKRSGGTEGYHLFYSPKQGICCQRIREGRLGAREVLIDGIRANFDAVIDPNDTIHLVCQDKNRNILYFLCQDEKWEKQTVLRAKGGTEAAADQFRLYRRGKYLRMTYIMSHKGESLLCSHELYGETPTPQVLDRLEEESPLYAITKDRAEDAILCYYSAARKELGTQRYRWGQKRWEEFEKVDAPLRCPGDLQLYADSRDTLHLCYKTGDTLCYRRKEFRFADSAWSAELRVAQQRNTLPVQPAFFDDRQRQRIRLCWCSGTALNGIYLPEGDGGWETAPEAPHGAGAKGTLFRLSAAADDEALSSLRYGFLQNGRIQFVGMEEFFTPEAPFFIPVGGAELPVRSAAPAGREAELFAGQAAAGRYHTGMPGSREEIEQKKREILESMLGPQQGPGPAEPRPADAADFSHPNDFDDFSEEYFRDLLRRQDEEARNAAAGRADSSAAAESDGETLPRNQSAEPDLARAVNRLAAALENFTARLQKGPQNVHFLPRFKQEKRKSAKLHNKIK